MKRERTETLQTHAAMTALGGIGYNLIELLWRGRTHWSMFLVGGICFEVMGGIHTRLRHRPLLHRCALCSAAVTAIELVSGFILNIWLKLGVWDYSTTPFNIKGQVCLGYSLLWLLLSGIACPLYSVCYRTVKWFSRRKALSLVRAKTH
ncbi:MAG: hypothetical protein IJO76_06555 [Clostridia bacterium]|nr:hypothetical protein [Clostridia bacterium]